MDRSKWEYKKLGEVCEVLDKLRKPVTKSDRVTGQYPYYGATGIQDYVADYIFDGRYLLLGEDGAKWGANDKSSFIIEGKSWVNNHAHILRINEDYMDVFVMYYLNHKDLSEYITGAVVPKLTQAAMVKIPIPAVSVSDQQRIVAELDCLNEMIAVKQEQLKEFDKLAQSIFYDMFGDPISNSKKWETIKLEKITKAEGGGTPSKNNPDYWGGEIAWVTSKDMKQMYISDSQIHITEAGVNNSPAHILPKGTILLVNRSGILKHTLPLALTTKEVTINQDLKALTITDERFLSLFVLYTLKGFAPFLLSRVKAVTVDSIEFSIFKKLEIPLSPLSLQQQFADKISAIEAQKELVKQSIAETQHLLDYTMDKYFG